MAYALPIHTSGKTQPCDLFLFPSFKSYLSTLLESASNVGEQAMFDEFDYFSPMREAHFRAFTRATVQV